MALVEQTGDRHYEVETHRMKGVLLLQQSIPDVLQAEECFKTALHIARRREAKSFELRTTIELSKLWQQLGKQEEAHQLLGEIYSGFSGKSNTADLQEAARLLEALTL